MSKSSWVPIVQYDPSAPHWLQNIPIGMLLVLVFLFVSGIVLCIPEAKKDSGKPPEHRRPRGVWRGPGARRMR